VALEPDQGTFALADLNANLRTASDLGLRRDQIHDARLIRDAEMADFPGIIPPHARRTLGSMARNQTRTALRQEWLDAAAMRWLCARSAVRAGAIPLWSPHT